MIELFFFPATERTEDKVGLLVFDIYLEAFSQKCKSIIRKLNTAEGMYDM